MIPCKMEPVQSSNIAEMGHDADASHLYIRFKSSGAVWKYHDVSPAIYAEMKAQRSVGGYLQQFVKPNHRNEKMPE